MEKLDSPLPHRSPGGKSGYARQCIAATQIVRQEIAELKGSRKAGLFASGAVHALRLLVEQSPTKPISYCRPEAEYWKETFAAWFGRVKRHFPEEYRESFLINVDEDFDCLIEAANRFTPEPWEQTTNRFHWRLEFANKERFDEAKQAAKENYPVKLGLALDKYLQACIERLLSDQDDSQPLVLEVSKDQVDRPGTVSTKMVSFDDGVCSLLMTNFDGFGRQSTNAYDVERAVKGYLKDHATEAVKDLNFDCESSMFCVRSAKMDSLTQVNVALYTLASDANVRQKYF